jgi:hypothetical protein
MNWETLAKWKLDEDMGKSPDNPNTGRLEEIAVPRDPRHTSYEGETTCNKTSP